MVIATAAATNLHASSCVTVTVASSPMGSRASAREERDLEAEFEYWSETSREIARDTFEAQAEAIRES